jgi:hypothetical protein
MDYETCRKTYQRFVYHAFHIEEDRETVRIVYDMEIEGLTSFHPTFTLKKPDETMVGDTDLFRRAAFSLGMVELISYWKTACPKETVIACGSLDEEDIRWWKKLYFNGLGEFFYKNQIETDQESFMELRSAGEPIRGRAYEGGFHGNLIPVGGGKDSFVSLDLLKDEKDENHAFVINRVMSAVHAAEAAGYTGDRLINPIRTLDQNMLDLNRKGYLNGHTPFSAMAAFAAYLTAVVYHKQYICLSNEASANESTIKGSTVNHQYSKTFGFEQDFNAYVVKHLNPSIHYFSLLRPLSELQIAGLFADLKQYHSIFRSCNVGQKEEKWCGHCAKCLFVGIMMSAYLPENEVVKIFGRNMLDDPDMKELFEQLSGLVDDKPFECVGTRDEVNTAIAMAIRRYQKEGKELPYLYRYYETTSYYSYYRDRSVDWKAYNTCNLLPEQFDRRLRKRLEEKQ